MKKGNRRTRAVIQAAALAMLLLVVYAAGILISGDAVEGDFLDAGRPPCLEHPFGTDALGRDLLMRTLKGMSVSMTVGAAASAISAGIAVFVGIAAAAGSGRVDAAISWLIDVMMSVPHMVLIILISFAMGRGFQGLLAGIAATHWCSLARLIRGEVLQLRSRHYIAVSRKLGKPEGWILTRHLLGHLAPQLVVGAILMFPHAILHEAAVSFLGFGLPPEQPATGIILAESMRYISAGLWWPAVLPGLTLVWVVLSVDRLGDELQKILNPFSAQE